MKFHEKLMVSPDAKVDLSKCDPDDTFGYKKNKHLKAKVQKTLQRLDDLQYMLFAENKRAVLVVLQAMDAGGKDGTIRHVMTGLNPQSCRVTAFGPPTTEEAGHDFLWRIHKELPKTGSLGIFNRSHYEDVLIVRVHKLVPQNVWSQRFHQINEFENYLVENHITVVKFFLHISKDEQKKRFQERIKDPDKRWKVSEADFKEREFWNEYIAAYEDALTRCNTKSTPWYIIPANKKWFRNLAVSHVMVEILESMNLKFPKPSIDLSKLKFK